MVPKTLNIIGCGKLGRSMATLWIRAEALRVGAVCNSTRASSERAVSILGMGTVCDSIADMPPAQVWMIATPDSDISHTAEQLLSAGTIRSGDLVFHCSGALAADVMACLRAQGALIGSLHPIRSFADPELAVENFEGTFCALEGDHGAIEVLQTICLAIGARLFTLEARAKVLCHVGHVFASNYLVALLGVAQDLYRAAGLPDEVVRGMIEPLARSSVENVCMLGSQRALTGPVVRGEYDVLSEHLRVLGDTSPAHAMLYRYLAQAVLEITRQRGELSEEKLQMLAQLVRI